MSAATPAELKRVQRAAAKADRARAELEAAMQAASAAGQPLRPIAAAAGLSVEWTRRLVAKGAS